jgi:hypothetical protein
MTWLGAKRESSQLMRVQVDGTSTQLRTTVYKHFPQTEIDLNSKIWRYPHQHVIGGACKWSLRG